MSNMSMFNIISININIISNNFNFFDSFMF